MSSTISLIVPPRYMSCDTIILSTTCWAIRSTMMPRVPMDFFAPALLLGFLPYLLPALPVFFYSPIYSSSYFPLVMPRGEKKRARVSLTAEQREHTPLIPSEKKREKSLRASIRALVETCLDNALMDGNGHDLYMPNHYTDVIPSEFHSDVEGLSGPHDGIICKDVVRSVNGIASLDFHYWLVAQIRKGRPCISV